jgi:hypothetical protein
MNYWVYAWMQALMMEVVLTSETSVYFNETNGAFFQKAVISENLGVLKLFSWRTDIII